MPYLLIFQGLLIMRTPQINSNLTEALISKGNTLGNIFKQYDEAIELLDKAIKTTKDFAFLCSIYYWQAKFYHDLKQNKRALETIKKGLELSPGENYFINLKLTVLISSWKEDKEIEEEAEQMLKDFIKKIRKIFD